MTCWSQEPKLSSPSAPTARALAARGPRLILDDRASRLNDGGCDPTGRFLVGSMALDDREGEERLVRLDAGQIVIIDDDLTLSNGLAFAPGGATFYSIDTDPARVVRVRSFDPATGEFGPRRDVLQIADGFPDGMCIDAAGYLWIAIWGAGQVRCYTPEGEHTATVEVAAPNTSSVAFVGRDLDVMLITTASEQLTDDQLVEFPDSGRLFTCRVGVTGNPCPVWSGP